MNYNSFYTEGQEVYDIHTKEKYTLKRRVNNFGAWWWVVVGEHNIEVKRPVTLFRVHKE